MRYKRYVYEPRAHAGGPQYSAARLRKAAQYVRMSTDQQKYSIDNQKQAIAEYALCHDIEVMHTYADEGRSGVLIKGREALLQLIADVQSGNAQFEIVLVYDVSRWGRFQDADESAYYEFICKSAGVSVEYCAEQFENNSGVVATLIKGMKRVTAGEYSRELSVKITRAHRRLASMGFHQGGPPNYGLRRVLVDENRQPKFMLREGQQKSLHGDRVILVPGPVHEVRTVQEIFRLFVIERASIRQIVRALAKNGIRNARGNFWSIQNIIDILSCEKYAGTFVYNRSSQGLDGRRTYHTPAKWLRVEKAIEPIVDHNIFAEAQCRLGETWKVSDVDLLNYLTATWCTTGYISSSTLIQNKCAPSRTCYIKRFGCLKIAYDTVGFKTSHMYRYEEVADILRQIDRDLIGSVTSSVVRAGGDVQYDERSELLRIDGGVEVRTVIVPYLDRENRGPGWRLYFRYISTCDLMLVARLNKTNTSVLDYYLLQYQAFSGPTFRFTRGRLSELKRNKLKSPAGFYPLCQQLSRSGQ